MSQTRYLKSMITPTLVEPTENHEAGVASGVWSTQDQLEARRGGVWPEAGVPNPDQFIENNFSIDLWTGSGAYNGSGSEQTITNGIDFTKGGMVWIKSRNVATRQGIFSTPELGVNNFLYASDSNAKNSDQSTTYSNTGPNQYNSDGFKLGDETDGFGLANDSGSNNTYVGWSFKKAPKFFDIVTYEGTGSARTVAHSLGGTVGMILIKNIDENDNWAVYHRGVDGSAPEDKYLILNTSAAVADSANWWNDTAPTTSVFTVGTDHAVNANGENYVAYLFAHETGSDSMIQCGSYTSSGANDKVIALGWEPQFVMVKGASIGAGWSVFDQTRPHFKAKDQSNRGNATRVYWDLANAEDETGGFITFESGGFNIHGGNNDVNSGDSDTYIYMAIRRPNMVTITDATKVFDLSAGDNSNGNSAGFPADMIIRNRTDSTGDKEMYIRSIGEQHFAMNKSDSEATATVNWQNEDFIFNGTGWSTNYDFYNFKRAKNFFDLVMYTGNGSNRTIAHGLTVVPEMIWIKCRSEAQSFSVYHSGLGSNRHSSFQVDSTQTDAVYFNNTDPTSTVFTVGTNVQTNENNHTFIALLFATVAGVSKIGSVAHSGSSTDVDCGFTAGARFVMVKRTDADGGWYFWDTGRGIVSGNDSYSLFNSNAAPVTNTDFIDPLSSGFTITGDFTDGTYLFYAIA